MAASPPVSLMDTCCEPKASGTLIVVGIWFGDCGASVRRWSASVARSASVEATPAARCAYRKRDVERHRGAAEGVAEGRGAARVVLPAVDCGFVRGDVMASRVLRGPQEVDDADDEHHRAAGANAGGRAQRGLRPWTARQRRFAAASNSRRCGPEELPVHAPRGSPDARAPRRQLPHGQRCVQAACWSADGTSAHAGSTDTPAAPDLPTRLVPPSQRSQLTHRLLLLAVRGRSSLRCRRVCDLDGDSGRILWRSARLHRRLHAGEPRALARTGPDGARRVARPKSGPTVEHT